MNAKQKMALVALFVLFFLLFNAPFLSIPNGLTGGLPRVMIYLGGCWIILIVAMAIIASKYQNRN